jgi:DNA modification methylase
MAHPVAERALAHFDALFPPDEVTDLPPASVEQITEPNQHVGNSDDPSAVVGMLIGEFTRILDHSFRLKTELREQCLKLVERIDHSALKPAPEREKGLFYSIKSKLKLNSKRAQKLYDLAASGGIIFNYREKKDIVEYLNRGDWEAVKSMVEPKSEAFPALVSILTSELPVSDMDALSALTVECRQTTNPRLKKVDHTMTDRMLEAMFSGFFFESFERHAMHAALIQDGSTYHVDFWQSLSNGREYLFNRENALWLACVDQNWAESDYENLRERVLTLINKSYDKINNHGFLCILIDDIEIEGRPRAWELVADATLYAERFVSEKLEKGYFQRSSIEVETRDYIKEINAAAGEFSTVNGGFTFLDCFVIRSDKEGIPAKRLLVFQKNCRDEMPLPCPACRSINVQGNSYSSLGVRSWECQNYICPDRSKSNRGKRYSFLSLLKQRALEDEQSAIPSSFIRMWRRDVVTATFDEVLEMVVRHYSIAGDTVTVIGVGTPKAIAGRCVRLGDVPEASSGQFENFIQMPFFNRFLVHKRTADRSGVIEKGDDSFLVLQGDSYAALQLLEESSVDGAITSPPYYNAREYAQWDNIYCHMYDMFNIARGVFRVLKPGSLYLYNIFDYFDNDRTITYSAMGDKRLCLSALTVQAFRSAGFWMMGNIVWDKGEIEGKRGYNGGNSSPYYQAPFNCWEHILIFAKPGDGAIRAASQLPEYVRAKPVVKMVGGRNVHGHTAPFPDALPEIMTSLLQPGACILDPFAGSMTSGRVAERHGLRSISIERDPDFVELGLRMRAEEQQSLSF